MKKLGIFSILLCCSASTLAAGLMKPGLWEIIIKSDALKNMSKISPEQKEQMKVMGVDIPQINNGSIVTKVCIPKEMAERDRPPPEMMNPNEADCEVRNYRRTGGSYSVDILCDGPVMKGQGRAQGIFSGNDNFTSTYDFKGAAQGHPLNRHRESKGRWLSADCGDLAPVDRLDDK